MRIHPAAPILVGFLACSCATQAQVPERANEDEITPPLVDLPRERGLLAEARTAAQASDLARARARAEEAIAALLARPEGERDASWGELLDAAGRTAWDCHDPQSAGTAWEGLLEFRSRLLPDEHDDIQNVRQDLSVALQKLGDLAGARVLEERVLEVRASSLPDDHADLQAARMNLAITVRWMGEFEYARSLEERVLEVYARTLPEDHPDLQKARLNLAATIFEQGDLEGALALGKGVLEVRSRTLPEDHPDLRTARQNLASTLYMQGDLRGAEALFREVLEACSRTMPADHPDLQSARQNLAGTRLALGDIAGARALMEEVLESLSRTLPDDHSSVQMARTNLATTLRTLGDFPAARALDERVLEIQLRTLPDDHPHLQAARQGLSATLYELGDFAGARALSEKVLEVRSATLPDDHPELQRARSNLAVMMHALGDVEEARALEERVLEVRLRTLPDDHPDLAWARSNLANTLFSLGEYEGARDLEAQVLEVRSRTLPDDHPDLQSARDQLAGTLATLGDLEGARALEQQVLEVSARTLPEDHHDLQGARANLALVIAAGHRPATAEEARGWKADAGIHEEFARLAAGFLRGAARSARLTVLTASGREAEEICGNSLPELGLGLGFAEGLGVFGEDAALEREAFVLSEETRGAALASARLRRRAVSDPRYGELREEIHAASDDLARLAQSGASADELDSARARRENAEQELLGLARKLSGAGAEALQIDPAALSASLSEREALIAYRRYTRWTFEPGRGLQAKAAESLCAFVLRSGDRLERVELGPVEPIERGVSDLREAIGSGGARGIGVVAAAPASEDVVTSRGGRLRRMIFDPLMPALEGADRLVVALDDILHLVPLDALPLEAADAGAPPGRMLLGDRWRLELRCSVSELAWEERSAPLRETLVALGGAAFDSAPLSISTEEPAAGEDAIVLATRVGSPLLRGGAWESGFEPLTGTGPEARGLADLYEKAFEGELPSVVLEDRRASRDALAQLAPEARFLHVATHGWIAPESVPSTADARPLDPRMGLGPRSSGLEKARGLNQMLLCGLALAGANLAPDELARAPGLVTAEELSTLDLDGCELAVLSACDTNVGERRAGQGVASLQKALHMAGARSVITSLWKVPDEATRELMLDFYRRIWIEGEPKGQALWEAKRKLREAKDADGRPIHATRDWAAWVLTGDP